jgi:hypothetical protein
VPQLSERLAGRKPGDTVQLSILREGQTTQIGVTLDPWPAQTN